MSVSSTLCAPPSPGSFQAPLLTCPECSAHAAGVQQLVAPTTSDCSNIGSMLAAARSFSSASLAALVRGPVALRQAS